MTVPLVGSLSVFKKQDTYPLKAEMDHLITFLKHYRKEIKAVDVLEFLSAFAFMGEYYAQDSQTLERIFRHKIPAGLPKTVTSLHRQFFEAIVPFCSKEFRGDAFSKTRGILVERLALVKLQCDEGVLGDSSMILLEEGESYGKKISASHEELDLVVFPANEEAAIGECKSDGSRFHKEETILRWYEAAAERIEREGVKSVHIFAVCATNADIMTKHLKSMVTDRRWWAFTISEKKDAWKIDP